MEKAKRVKQIILFLLVFILAILYDKSDVLIKEGIILRNNPMEGDEEVALIINAEGLPKDYLYELEVKETLYTQTEASHFFKEAKTEIDKDFQKVLEDIPARESYVSEKVEAEWSFSPRTAIHTDYSINQEEIPKEGMTINAIATLRCGGYEELYVFPFLIEKKPLTKEEQIVVSLQEWFDTEMQKEGVSEVLLPKEMNGISLQWSEKEEYMPWKVLCFEIILFLLLYFREREQKKETKKQYLQRMEQEYPKIVGSLSVLLGAGMTVKQAWNVMANQYIRKGEKEEEQGAWKEIVLLNRKIQEGEGEKEALLQMMERIPLMCYHRLIRMLLTNRDKGTKGLCEMLDKEAETAYEQQVLNMRKIGEEASTKLLMPMIIMLFLVMAIVILPAFINFSI